MSRERAMAGLDRLVPPPRVDFSRYASEGHVREDLADPPSDAERHQQAWDKALLLAVPWRAAERLVAGEFDADWPALRLAQTWIDDPKAAPHIMFRGPSRSGKTLASAAIVRHWVEPGMRRGEVRLLHPNALISAMLHDYDPQSPKIDDKVRLVVVDDIGRETKRVGLVEALCLLLDRRKIRVVMSTNLGKNDFRKVYGEDMQDDRLLARLRETTFAADVKPGGDLHAPGDF